MNLRKAGRSSKPPVRGLGDVVDRVTSKTGIKTAVNKVAAKLGRECGCEQRQEALNKLIPFGKGEHTDG
jgi:hypothetical protein